MDKCVIGIDIDGTINEAHKWDIIHGREFCIKHKIHTEEKLNECSVQKMFNLTGEMYELYLNEYFPWNVNHDEVKMGAAETIREWVRLGHIIKIITARNPHYKGEYAGQMMVEDTKHWFEKHNIPYHDLLFGCTNKSKSCRENDVDIFIDDDPKHIIPVAKLPRTTVLIAGQSYNEYLIGHKNTTWCNDWLDIRQVVHELTNMY